MHLDVVVSQVYWSLIVSIPWCWFVFFYYLFALVDEKRASNIYTKTYQD